jgi:cell division protein FtsB
MLSRVPKIFRNFFFLTTAFFLVWMLFFDANDFVKQYKMSRKLGELEAEKDHYLQKIAEVQKDRAELLSNSSLLEKFAREKYYMKRPGEDIFIIVEEEK